ncbi:hypothetical protein [Aureivirga marina]|uniref:hypothetical protein n=1 Tax=Aureivirga marina TaxID=1182451 RepID=UPI0018CB930A|nr:hypothetical protein [Aureivirga marina]
MKKLKFISFIFLSSFIISCGNDKVKPSSFQQPKTNNQTTIDNSDVELNDSEVSETIVDGKKLFEIEGKSYWANTRKQVVDDFTFTATQLPMEYYIRKNLGLHKQEAIEKEFEKIKKGRIIDFKIQKEAATDILEEKHSKLPYEEAVKYMAFKIQNDFYGVTSSGDTIPCIGAHFERTFKLSPFKRILLFFDNINPDETIQVIYNDKMYRKGILKFNMVN